MALAATNVQPAGANCKRHDAPALVGRPRRFSAGPKPGAASFTLELGGLAVQKLVIRAARMPTHESLFPDAAEP
jgi:hypothetical protein